ncbi:hypothetical protein Tco_0320846 [Tanacetum coccineum]
MGQPPLQIMKMFHCFVNEHSCGLCRSNNGKETLSIRVQHPTSTIPYPKIYNGSLSCHYMTIFPNIYKDVLGTVSQTWQDDDIMKNIFNSGRHKNKVGMQIPAWMITDEMKQTEHYQDVHLTQKGKLEESSAPTRRSTVIRLRIPERRSTRLTPPALVPTVDKADEMILQDTLQVCLLVDIKVVRIRTREKCGTRRVKTLPTMVDKHIKEQVMKQVPEQVRNQVPVNVEIFRLKSRNKLRMQLPMSFLLKLMHPRSFERNTRQKTSKYEAICVLEGSSSGQVFQDGKAPTNLGNQKQDDDFDFWTDSYASDDDEIPTKQVSQDIMEEVSMTIDEAKLRKMADEMLRQRCTSRDEH